jgi:hypothetical protein
MSPDTSVTTPKNVQCLGPADRRQWPIAGDYGV